MIVANWRTQCYNVIQSLLFDNPLRTVTFLVQTEDGRWVDRRSRPAPVRRLAETPAPPERSCLRTIQFVHHVIIPPGGRHVWELHIHPDAEELIVIMDGEGVMRLGDDCQPVSAGDVIYVPPDALHELRNEGEDLLAALFVNVPVGEGLRRLLAGETVAPPR